MKHVKLIAAATALVALGACAPTSATQRNANCVVGTAGGAALGAVVGSEFGRGTGRDIATVLGAAGGGLAGANYLCQ